MFSKNLTTVSGNITPYMAAAIFYLIVTLPLIKVVSIVEHRLARSESGAGPRPGKGTKVTTEENASAEELQSLGTSIHCEVAETAKSKERSAWEMAMAPFRPQTTMGGMNDAR